MLTHNMLSITQILYLLTAAADNFSARGSRRVQGVLDAKGSYPDNSHVKIGKSLLAGSEPDTE